MGIVTSSGRRWVGCWAWRQRRSAAGRRQEKLWRNVRGRPPSTLWYDCWTTHWISSTYHYSLMPVLTPFSILPSLFRKEASPTRHFLQKMTFLNLVSYEKTWCSHWIHIYIYIKELFSQKQVNLIFRQFWLIAAVWYSLMLLERDFSHRLVQNIQVMIPSLVLFESFDSLIFRFSFRFALNARKLASVSIWQTVTVRLPSKKADHFPLY